jgi:hypothetical protein
MATTIDDLGTIRVRLGEHRVGCTTAGAPSQLT